MRGSGFRFYVYELVDPRDQSVFYVGKGKDRRMFQHASEARGGKRGLKCDRIRQIYASGHVLVEREVARFLDEDDAYNFEADLIADYGLENLTNVIPGGTGAYERYAAALERQKAKPVDYHRFVERNAKLIQNHLCLFGAGVKYTIAGAPGNFLEAVYAAIMSIYEKVGQAHFERHVGIITTVIPCRL
jgi:hypothetical protein